MRHLKLFLGCSLLTALIALAGCGQKGPLYLEDEQSQETTEQAAS